MITGLSRNIVSSLAQALIGALLLFAFYRYVSITLGIEKLGLWAIVLSTVSVSRLVDLGFSTGVTRYVASLRARGELSRAAQVIDTALITSWCVIGIIIPVLYPIISMILPEVLDSEELKDARGVLPYAFISLWLSVGAGISLGGLAGCERIDLQAYIVLAGQALLLLLAMLFVPYSGLYGIAYAQLCQALFTLTIGRWLLSRILPQVRKLPRSWAKASFKELLEFSANMQATSVAQWLFETSTKLMMSRFGDTAAVGYFEVANQLVVRARMIIATSNQAIVPHVAIMAENNYGNLSNFYRANLRILFFVAPPVFTLLISWSGAFSWTITGGMEERFIEYFYILCAAWFCNIFNAPAYFMNIATGRLKWNTLSHITMAFSNVILGLILGHFLGAIGVVFSYASALTLGSAFLIFSYAIDQAPRSGAIASGDTPNTRIADAALVMACLALVLATSLQHTPQNPMTPQGALHYLISPFVLGIFMWLHPTRSVILDTLRRREIHD
jgi:O-antigen/teichoic acid export membrane protein